MLGAPDSCSGTLGGRRKTRAKTTLGRGPGWMCEARARGPAHRAADTERVQRDAEWPARVPAARETFQAETGRAERGTVTADDR